MRLEIKSFDESVEAAEIGYCMSRALWGRGIIPEALKAVMDFLFDEAGFHRVAAYFLERYTSKRNK